MATTRQPGPADPTVLFQSDDADPLIDRGLPGAEAGLALVRVLRGPGGHHHQMHFAAQVCHGTQEGVTEHLRGSRVQQHVAHVGRTVDGPGRSERCECARVVDEDHPVAVKPGEPATEILLDPPP
jgi:hypothetical protein